MEAARVWETIGGFAEKALQVGADAQSAATFRAAARRIRAAADAHLSPEAGSVVPCAQAHDGLPAAAGAISSESAGGRWISAACWHNCGGQCMNKVYVQDGIVMRQKTDDIHPDSPAYPQQRACPRGRAQREQCFAADRLKFPLKRKHWSPDDPQGHLRGRDEWERISWDEAFAYCADQLARAYSEAGPRSVLSHGGGPTVRVLHAMGGTCGIADTTSMGTYCLDTTKLGLPLMDAAEESSNDRFDLPHAEWIVFQGCNPAWASGGSPSYYFLQAKRAGVRFAMIGPSCNETAQLLDAKWIRVRPGTDTAFMLGVAYEMLALDRAGEDTIDWDFLDACTVGFDQRHLPADAASSECFEDYLLGAYDGVPKTAAWASAICGTPVADIRWYARLLGRRHKVMMLHSFSHARNHDAEDVPQLFMTLGAMGGHFGKSGHCCGAVYHRFAANGGPSIVRAGSTGVPRIPNEVDDRILGPVLWKSILQKRYTYIGDFYDNVFTAAQQRAIDIRVIYHGRAARLQTTPAIIEGVEAHRSVDFVFSSAQFLTAQARYSDIILPVTTEWERVGGLIEGNREALFVYTQVTEPLFQAKTDEEIGKGIAAALGLDVPALFPLSETQQFMNGLAGCRMTDASGASVPLLTMTQDDFAQCGCDGSAQQGVVGVREFLADGCYQVPRFEGDSYGYIAYEDFAADPEHDPLPSASGKLEISCRWKADALAGFGFSAPGLFKPYPSYHAAAEGYETTFADWDARVAGPYPLLAFNPHYYRRSHTVFDTCSWLKTAWSNPVFMNASDASARGISTGDRVVVFNGNGRIVLAASVVETLMPGAVAVPHGAWLDLDEGANLDFGGSDNVLCGSTVSGMAVSGYNNCMVEVVRYDDAAEGGPRG
jgi:anaerobic dimethyl sulfoxide reductase subunit A